MRISILLILLSLSSLIFAQKEFKINLKSKKYIHSLQFSAENGVMVSNGTELADKLIDHSYYNGLDIQLGWTKTNIENTYNKVYRFPTLGIGWYSSTFHNSNIGNPNALYFFFNIPIHFEENKRLTGSYIGAFGLSYNFNPYNENNNTANVLIGSYQNCYLHMGYNLNYHISNMLSVFGSAGFKHFSNGAFKLPNKGINLFPIGLGVKYKFSGKKLERPVAPPAPFISHNQWNIMLAVGSKNYKHDDPNYLKSTLGFNYLRQFSYKYRLGAGMDFFYSAASDLRNHSSQSGFSKSVSYALVASWEWVINRIVYAPIGFGYYIHRNFENGEEKNYYERIGLRVRLSEHYNLGVTIKAHGGHADFFECTFAYTFHKDPNAYQ